MNNVMRKRVRTRRKQPTNRNWMPIYVRKCVDTDVVLGVFSNSQGLIIITCILFVHKGFNIISFSAYDSRSKLERAAWHERFCLFLFVCLFVCLFVNNHGNVLYDRRMSCCYC